MPTSFDLIVKNGKCFIDGQLKIVDIGISEGIIKSIGKIEKTSNEKILDANNLVILPGVIDTQVHFREPGSTDVEDLESGSKAAVLGGVTSVFEMPNTNPPTSNQTEFNKKLSFLLNSVWLDVGGLVLGISNTEVTPPKTAALLPDCKSSTSVEPGSLK